MTKLKAKTKQLKLSEINELSMCVFIVTRELEDKVQAKLSSLQAKVVSVVRGVGVSRFSVFASLKVGTTDMSVIFALARVEDTKKIMKNVSIEFSLAKPGNGKSFVIDINGYLGAKAKFMED